MTPPPSQLAPDEFSAEADHLEVDLEANGLAIVTLSNPEMRNAMSPKMTHAWARLMTALREDHRIRAVVVVGAGKAFCSGGDTSWIGSEPDASVDQLRTRMTPFYRTWLGLRDVPVPVVVGLNGPAIGAGACLALAGDVRVAAESAKFAVPFLKLGMHPGMATTYLLPEIAGIAVARDLLFTGRVIDSSEMLRTNIATQVLPDEGFVEALKEIGRGIAQTAPIATKLAKAVLREGPLPTLNSSVEWEALAQPITLATRDLQEGLAAAREKRTAVFTGE